MIFIFMKCFKVLIGLKLLGTEHPKKGPNGNGINEAVWVEVLG